MTWPARLLVCALAAMAGWTGPARAEIGSFDFPSVRGERLDWCRTFGGECGKPAADLFCREMGFTEAVRFLPDENVGASGIRTLVFGQGRFCEGPNCTGFRNIVCTRPDSQPAPTIAAPALTAPPPAAAPIPLGRTQPPTLAQPPALPLPPLIALPPASPPVLAPPPTLPPPPTTTFIVPVLPEAGPPTGSPPGQTAVVVSPGSLLPGGATLEWCAGGTNACEFKSVKNFNIDTDSEYHRAIFYSDVSKIPTAGAFVWQVAASSFPRPGSSGAADLAPSNLIASGAVDKTAGDFELDFKAILGPTREPPAYLYVRILPVATAGSNFVVGQPSNTLRGYYMAVPPPPPPVTVYDMTPPHLYDVRIVSFTPADIEVPHRWGCVTVTGHKASATSQIKSDYPVGKEFCPKVFSGGGSQITSVGEFFEWVAGGFAGAVNWISDRYDDLKKLAVDIIMKYTPFGLQCQAMGELIDDKVMDYCGAVAEIAVNAGLAALGLPPSIPNYNALIDKGVDYAVELAVAEIEAQTGVPCIGPCKDALQNGFQAAANDLKQASYQPGCVGENEAHQHGSEPLCLPSSVVAKPAKGAVYAPPMVEVEITRNFADKGPGNAFSGTCKVSAGIHFENHFPGGTVWGPKGTGKTMEVPAQKIEGKLFGGGSLDIPPSMKKGTKMTTPLVLHPPLKYIFPWTKQLWIGQQLMAADEKASMGPDWYTLYRGAKATIDASTNCAAEGDTVIYQVPAKL